MATTASFSGVGSGIDFGIIRDAILNERTKPVTQMQTKVSTYSGRIDALTQLNAALAALTTASEALTSRDLGASRSVGTGDATVITGSAGTNANLGNYDISISRLASTLAKASRSYASTTAPVLAGGATTATFELRKGGAAIGTALTIDSTNDTLEGLRDAINAKNAGVTASIVDVTGDGTGQQLVLGSTESGAIGRVDLVETTSTGTLTSLNLRSLNPPDGDPAKLDAALTINGLGITRSTNTISNAVTGVTLNLKKVGSTSFAVAQSTDIENKLRGFINAYNVVQDFAAAQYKKDTSNRPTGVLAGDTTLRAIQGQLRDATAAASASNGGSLTSLAELGITKDETGKLSLDPVVFNDKLKTSPDDVKALLYGKTSTDSGLFTAFTTVSKGLSDGITGSVQNAISGYQSSVKTLNSRISERLDALNRLKTSLTNKYSVADAAIGQLNGQQSSLTNIIKAYQNASNNGSS